MTGEALIEYDEGPDEYPSVGQPSQEEEEPVAFDPSRLPRLAAEPTNVPEAAVHVHPIHSVSSPPLERLSEDDARYNRYVWQKRVRADAEAVIARGAMEVWWQFVREKYGLAEADGLNEEGIIDRVDVKEATDGD